MWQRKVIALVSLVLIVGSALAEETFRLDGNNTTITFVGSKNEGKHDGGFKSVKGTATVDGSEVTTAKVTVEIDMNSLYSDNQKLTAHLKSPDFFGVKSKPNAKFVSKKIVKADDGYTVTGDLSMNGVTKSLSFPAQIELGDDTLTLTSDFAINRHDWKISYGKGKIHDEVKLSIKVAAKK